MSTYPNLTIKNWAEEDQPREKLLLKGKTTLSDAELVAIIIGSGTASLTAVEVAKQILNGVDNDLNALAKLSIKELMKFKGIGVVKAINIISALELGRRKRETEIAVKPKIAGANDVFELMLPHLSDLAHEEFWVLLLSRRNTVIKKVRISSGGVSATVVDPKIIFKSALEELASSVILVHNHPSGNLKPSKQDILLTNKIKKAGEALEVNILDHVIFADGGYYSFVDQGIF